MCTQTYAPSTLDSSLCYPCPAGASPLVWRQPPPVTVDRLDKASSCEFANNPQHKAPLLHGVGDVRAFQAKAAPARVRPDVLALLPTTGLCSYRAFPHTSCLLSGSEFYPGWRAVQRQAAGLAQTGWAGGRGHQRKQCQQQWSLSLINLIFPAT